MSDSNPDITDPKWQTHLPRHVARIVEEQVGRWKLHQAPANRSSQHWPVITISRQFGANAEEVGRRIAGRLGFSYWDHQIVTSIAEAFRIDELTVEQLDEHARGVIEDLLSVTLFGQGMTEPDYGEQLRHLLRAIDRRGSAVIVGRGAHCIVDPGQSLRVRVICPIAQRVAMYCARSDASEETALRRIRAADRDRADFVRREFGVDVDESSQYDLTINSATFGPSRADALIMMAYLAKFGQLPNEAHEGLAEPRANPVVIAPSPIA